MLVYQRVILVFYRMIFGQLSRHKLIEEMGRCALEKIHEYVSGQMKWKWLGRFKPEMRFCGPGPNRIPYAYGW